MSESIDLIELLSKLIKRELENEKETIPLIDGECG
jgi:hypothetical protein